MVADRRDERRGELLAPAPADRRPADDREGHVAADAGGDLAQFLDRQTRLPELVAGDQRGGGVGAAASQPARDRYPLADRDGHPGVRVRPRIGRRAVAGRDRLAKRPHRAQRQVVAVGGHMAGAFSATVTLSALAATTVTSSNSETAWKTVTSPW